MSKELSNWYKYDSYNSGVILIDIRKSLQYPWKQILEETIQDVGVTQLADQDIFNVIDRKTRGKWFHRIDCGLNLQHAGWKECSTSCVRIIHFNAMPNIQNTTNLASMLNYARKTYQSIGCETTIFPHDNLFNWIGNSNISLICK
ncbi:predicted protein [Naegleria gruberi]|uniref:Predicted protein n=1 Tax=Naegleria gruberi TaxID=5762 RepID=D2VSU8_NAEGR|nr:uncharacterized protein NAEGRDRAFT_72068 [Naegleria gruberi]EFC39963.1 predicted protein [Naegleria gruberi]|eukprot:XP_002672707.1 predicted protein [Naegleria gruberi strain NEG-M]